MTAENTCPLCGTLSTELVTNRVRFGREADVRNCSVCSLLYLDQTSFDLPRDFYEADYHQTYLTHVEPDALDPKTYYEKMKKATAIWAKRFSSMLTGMERVLDVGCSSGHFIDLIKDRTAFCAGHELNKKEVEFCREILKLDVDSIPLAERFEEGSFDFITLIFVLEHIAEPEVFLGDLKRFLKPGGQMVIVVPNAMDPLLKLYDLPEFRNFYFCVEHLFYYTEKTIRELFGKVGLSGTVETVQEYPLANHLNWACKRGPSDTLAARLGLPDVPLAQDAPEANWSELWKDFDDLYQRFLKLHGYGDRLWCVVSKEI